MKYYEADGDIRCVECGCEFSIEDTYSTTTYAICPYCSRANGIADTYLDGFEEVTDDDELYIDGYLSNDIEMDKPIIFDTVGTGKKTETLVKDDKDFVDDYLTYLNEKEIDELPTHKFSSLKSLDKFKYKKKKPKIEEDKLY